MIKRGRTIVGETSDIEVLDLQTALIHDWNSVEYVRIGVLEEDASGEDGSISFCLVQFDADWHCEVLQAILLEGEIDIVIEGLKEAKRRLLGYKAACEDQESEGGV